MIKSATMRIEGIRVFSATLARERERLGEWVTDWLAAEGDRIEIVDHQVLQSSDAEYHCLTIVIFYCLAPTESA